MFYSYIKLFPFRFSVLSHNICVRIPFHVLKLMDLLTYSLSPTGTYIPCVRIHLLSLCRDSPTFLVSGFTYFPCVGIPLLSLCQESPTFPVSGITYFSCVRNHLLSLCQESPTFPVSGFPYFPCVRNHLLSLCQASPTFPVSGFPYFPFFRIHLLSLCQESPTFPCVRIPYICKFKPGIPGISPVEEPSKDRLVEKEEEVGYLTTNLRAPTFIKFGPNIQWCGSFNLNPDPVFNKETSYWFGSK